MVEKTDTTDNPADVLAKPTPNCNSQLLELNWLRTEIPRRVAA